MEEKMAKFVDERVENLIPCLVKKIEDKLNKVEQKSEIKEGTTHQTKCTGCGVEPIIGIRYKCTKCPSFDFCEACESKIPHDHNMIKMRFLEEPEKEDDNLEPGFRKGWWKRPWEHRGPPHHFGHPHDHPHPPHHRHHGRHHSREEDNGFRLTKKCFKMAKFFGESPEKYREFVEKNIDLRFNELTNVYVAENEGVAVSSQANEKVEERLEKLSFYFNEPKNNFESVIKKNPASNFKDLIRIVKESKASVVQAEEKLEKKEEDSQVE